MSRLRNDLKDVLDRILGPEQVLADPGSRAHCARTTGVRGTTPLLVARPCNTEQVREVLRIAREFNVSVHPMSCGKNWGYGDACGTEEGQILLDLSRMNRIIEVDTELGYAVVEPGVSQGQLADWLEANDVPFVTDATGAGHSASIVGNAVERGFGHSQNIAPHQWRPNRRRANR